MYHSPRSAAAEAVAAEPDLRLVRSLESVSTTSATLPAAAVPEEAITAPRRSGAAIGLLIAAAALAAIGWLLVELAGGLDLSTVWASAVATPVQLIGVSL